jgi:hypothetical protein
MKISTRLAHGIASAIIVALMPTALAMPAMAEPPAAFARASPLPVAPDSSLKNPLPTDFDYGRSYEVLEKTSKFVKLALPEGKVGYVKPETVVVSETPSWISTTPLFGSTNRPNLRLWKESSAIAEYIKGNMSKEWDYEELLDEAPRFSIRMPTLQSTTVKMLGGDRDVTIVTALFPLPGSAANDIREIKDGKELRTNVHIIADISGSTRDFLEPAMRQIVDLLSGKEFKSMIGKVTLTRYASSLPSLAEFTGPLPIRDLTKQDLRKAAAMRGDDAEPLLTALATAAKSMKGQEASNTALIILSGADVNPAPITLQGATITPEQITLPANTTTFVTQITPEPGESLQKLVRSLARTRLEYVPYGDNAVRSLVVKLSQLFDENRKQAISEGAFKNLSKRARTSQMIPILPRDMEKDAAGLPDPPPYLKDAKWYTIPLSLAVDGLVYKLGR